MHEPITWVALDTSKAKHVAAILGPVGDEMRDAVVPNEERAIRRFARKLVREAPGDVRLCYEAGPCGYALQRQLVAAAPTLVCQIVAPSLIPIRPGDRIKTDHRDARKLVKLFRSGELTPVQPPTLEQEIIRDLVRTREQVLGDLTRNRHRLARFLLRRGIVFTEGRPWTQRHSSWLSRLVWDHPADELIFQEYRLSLAQLAERLQTLDVRIKEFSQQDTYREAVGWLRCFRGIDTLSAMTWLTELQDLKRFPHPRALSSYLGLVPSEHSSGERTARGHITKTGNRHVRRILVQIVWHYQYPPNVGPALRQRRLEQPAWVLSHADRAMSRLRRRFLTLTARGKSRQQIAIALARELAGFLWAVSQEGQLRQLASSKPA
jgi:transposase